MPEPGLYLINASGETSALATESGGGDRQLLIEALADHLSLADIMAAEEAIMNEQRPD